jgi:hypothetical protein
MIAASNKPKDKKRKAEKGPRLLIQMPRLAAQKQPDEDNTIFPDPVCEKEIRVSAGNPQGASARPPA